jgi:hypothetical protein
MRFWAMKPHRVPTRHMVPFGATPQTAAACQRHLPQTPFVSTHLEFDTDSPPLSAFRSPLQPRRHRLAWDVNPRNSAVDSLSPEGRHRSVSKAATGARSGMTIDVAPPGLGLSAACQIGRRSETSRSHFTLRCVEMSDHTPGATAFTCRRRAGTL